MWTPTSTRHDAPEEKGAKEGLIDLGIEILEVSGAPFRGTGSPDVTQPHRRWRVREPTKTTPSRRRTRTRP